MIKRRGIEEFSVSFLDVICCGFGAIILLLMVTKTLEPAVLEDSNLDLSAQIAAREQAVFDIKGKIEELRQELANDSEQLQLSLTQQANVQQQLSDILGRFKTMTLSLIHI